MEEAVANPLTVTAIRDILGDFPALAGTGVVDATLRDLANKEEALEDAHRIAS